MIMAKFACGSQLPAALLFQGELYSLDTFKHGTNFCLDRHTLEMRDAYDCQGEQKEYSVKIASYLGQVTNRGGSS